jgi:hypothetical protein
MFETCKFSKTVGSQPYRLMTHFIPLISMKQQFNEIRWLKVKDWQRLKFLRIGNAVLLKTLSYLKTKGIDIRAA